MRVLYFIRCLSTITYHCGCSVIQWFWSHPWTDQLLNGLLVNVANHHHYILRFLISGCLFRSRTGAAGDIIMGSVEWETSRTFCTTAYPHHPGFCVLHVLPVLLRWQRPVIVSPEDVYLEVLPEVCAWTDKNIKLDSIRLSEKNG
jgi:hypothetical protein